MAGFDSMSMLPPKQDAQALAWWTRAQLDVVRDRLAQVFSAWASDWVLDAAKPGATAVLAHERPDRENDSWLPIGAQGAAAAWIQTRHDPAADLFQTLFAVDAGLAGNTADMDGIGRAACARAWGALADALRR